MSSSKKSAPTASSAPPAAPAAPLNPKTTHLEWNGTAGAFGCVIGLPIAVIAINAVCSEHSCTLLGLGGWNHIKLLINDEISKGLAHLIPATYIWLAWFLFHSLVYISPLGVIVNGLPLRNGQTLKYRINGLHAYIICHVGVAAAHHLGFFNLGYLIDIFSSLALSAILLSTLLALVLYAASFRSPNVLLATGGNSGSLFYDFWVGRELNPRIGELDLKFMCELRPGLIGWSILGWAFVARSYQAGTLEVAHVLVALFQSYYVADAMYFESGNTSMMDIAHDGFGFMLSFGDHAWVPFLYTLQSKFLHYNPQVHDLGYLFPVVLLNCLGYTIFRGANSQKDRFRFNPKDPRVSHLKTMPTQRGTNLIISGFWGICRHPNYVGDWFMTLSWCLLTGTGSILPYFQAIYFAILLIHRQLRDEQQMLRKYGKDDWERYCKHVPYRLIPYIY